MSVIRVKNLSKSFKVKEKEKGFVGSIKAIVKPEDATNKTLTWVSNNPQVAEVDQNGVVTAKAEGEATITATSVNGKKAIAIIKVSK